jgi:hypothetical protein
MSRASSLKRIATVAAPIIPAIAPALASSFARETLHRAIDGVSRLPPAAESAERQRAALRGDRDKAVVRIIDLHVGYAGAQGLVTNLGGVVAAAAAIPANLAGLALVQTRMVAGIAHLRGYDLADPRVRNAVLACLLTEDGTKGLLSKGRLPAPPMTIATAPVHDPTLDDFIAAEIVSAMVKQVAGKRLVTTIGRRTPVLGGVVGAGSDAYATYQVGRFAKRELLARHTGG